MRNGKDEYLVLGKFYLENKELTPHKLLIKSNENDLISKKFSKNTIYSQFLCFKRFMKDGYICKAMSKKLHKVLTKLTTNSYKQKVITTQSYEDIEKFFNEQYQSLNEKCNKIREDIELQLSILNNKLRELDKYYENKCKEIQEHREVLIREFFERS